MYTERLQSLSSLLALKLGFFFMVKSFFGTLVDPTSLDSVKHAPIDRTSTSGKSKKGKGVKNWRRQRPHLLEE